MKYVSNLSGGKDSVAMTIRLIEEGFPLDYAVFYDGGMEFKATYKVIDVMEKKLESYGSKLIRLKPETDFLVDMLLKPVKEGTNKEHYGYDWCGGCTRWRTTGKISLIDKFLSTIGEYQQFVGIAVDEPDRVRQEKGKSYPLVDWNMTEPDCLEYCFSHGINWQEDGIELYNILDRVSCWCCGNKNLKELRNMYHYLPYYWGLLKGMQSRIDRPFYNEYTIFQLEERFKAEDAQMDLFRDFGVF